MMLGSEIKALSQEAPPRHIALKVLVTVAVAGIGQLPVLSHEQLKETSREHPDAGSDSRTLSRRVLPLADSGSLLERYYARRAQQKAVER